MFSFRVVKMLFLMNKSIFSVFLMGGFFRLRLRFWLDSLLFGIVLSIFFEFDVNLVRLKLFWVRMLIIFWVR